MTIENLVLDRLVSEAVDARRNRAVSAEREKTIGLLQEQMTALMRINEQARGDLAHLKRVSAVETAALKMQLDRATKIVDDLRQLRNNAEPKLAALYEAAETIYSTWTRTRKNPGAEQMSKLGTALLNAHDYCDHIPF